MTRIQSFSRAAILCALIFLSGLSSLDAGFVDHSSWDLFLKQFVNEKGEVNYRAIQKDTKLLDQYLLQLAAIEAKEYASQAWPREERLAIWLNTYHVGVIRAIIKHYPVKSIQDISGIWEERSIRVSSHLYSLNQIREDVLMKGFHDEKIHTALACGAKSCPKVRREAFTAERVDGQLFLAAREFVNDPALNRIIPEAKKIEISKLFQWHAGDFKLNFGVMDNDRDLSTEDYAVLSFLAHYLENADQVEYLEQGNYKLKYLPFDWRLNEWQG